jgi:hypothetical protein
MSNLIKVKCLDCGIILCGSHYLNHLKKKHNKHFDDNVSHINRIKHWKRNYKAEYEEFFGNLIEDFRKCLDDPSHWQDVVIDECKYEDSPFEPELIMGVKDVNDRWIIRNNL